LGVVTRVDDPDKFGRVKAALPSYHNVETEWMQVIHPAAGVNKGLIALPGVDDTVLVLFTHSDPARGVVLGGFYGPFAAYDPGVDGNAVKRYSLRTPQGHLIRLDDEHHIIRVEHSQGSFVEMTPDKVTVHAAGDLELSAPGKKIVVEGAAIDFRKA
jgi:phage baseplate assembly protein gpV